ncbi:MAG: hypothetical protein CM1200mP41_22970 [Gammaproteobacteria bacterium]|nr:MAG: hypothetical protein CM1200mP41_22970 [Gammaproteobacteria bacterium]
MALVGVVQQIYRSVDSSFFTAFLIRYECDVDSTYGTGKKWWEAHSEHYYQRAVRAGFTHAQVAAGAMTLTALAAGLAQWRRSTLLQWDSFLSDGGPDFDGRTCAVAPGIREVLTRNRSG